MDLSDLIIHGTDIGRLYLEKILYFFPERDKSYEENV